MKGNTATEVGVRQAGIFFDLSKSTAQYWKTKLLRVDFHPNRWGGKTVRFQL